MPFIYPKNKRIFEEYNLRDFFEIDSIMKEALEDVQEWKIFSGAKVVKKGKDIHLINTKRHDPPKEKADPKKFLVLLSLTKGLNLGEIESWLDYNSINYTGEFHFDLTSIVYIDERRLYYKQPRGIPCSFITWYPDRREG
jgi:hypothetical protein